MSKFIVRDKFYVVFEGRNPGIYMSWPEADVQVNGFKGNRHERYNSYERAWFEWMKYCQDHSRDPYNYCNARRGTDGASSSRKPRAETCSTHIVKNVDSNALLPHHNMQGQLQQICHTLRFAPPSYKLHEVKVINGQQYKRYYAAIQTSALGRPMVSIGRLARTDYDAQEDVAALLLRRLLDTTGEKIRDCKNYNVHILEDEVENRMDEKVEMAMEIEMLKDEMRKLKAKFSEE